MKKRYYYKKYKKFRNQSNYLLYCIARARVHNHIRKNKRQKEVKIAKNIKSNAKTFYQYISSKSCKKDKIPDLIKADGTKTKNDEEKSRELNNFFSSVFTTENNDEFPYMQDKVNEDKHIHQANITKQEMESLLKDLKPNKSPGTDEIHPLLLRKCCSSLSKPLKILFDLTMKLSKIPDEWKKSRGTAYIQEKRQQE